MGVSLLLMIASFGLALWILNGHRSRGTRCLVLALVLCDLYAFDWSALNRAQAAAKGADELDRLTRLEGAAGFLKSREGPFRVQMAMNAPPNAGDAFGIQTTWGAGVTLLRNYDQTRGLTNLFNVRYTIKPASAGEPGAVYQDASWKIYENPAAGPRAWLVHETTVEESPNFNPRKRALLARPLETALDPAGDPAAESVNIDGYRPEAIELSVKTQGRALLVLSEVFYPGWQATVNGQRAAIVEVDRALRGIPVPSGESRVVVAYRPGSVAAGAALTLISFCLLPVALLWLRRRPTPDGS